MAGAEHTALTFTGPDPEGYPRAPVKRTQASPIA